VLHWSKRDFAGVSAALERAAFGTPPRAEIRPFGDEGVWVSIPRFWGDAQFEAFLKRVIAEAASWRIRKRVVFDLRGNTGGNSAWGALILTALFGEARIDAIQDASPATQVDWRVSTGNLAHLRKLEEQVARQFGADSEALAWIRSVIAGIDVSMKAGRALWREPSTNPPKAKPVKSTQTPLPGTVYLLTDGRCGSACLDFLDLSLALPHVEHVGLPTAADSPYMEIRSEVLPSKLASCSFAMKVYRGRARNDQPYVPKVRFAGDIADTAALEKWIGQLPSP
jgi:hypothetical protein